MAENIIEKNDNSKRNPFFFIKEVKTFGGLHNKQ